MGPGWSSGDNDNGSLFITYISHHAKKLVKAQGKAIIATIFAHLGQNG